MSINKRLILVEVYIDSDECPFGTSEDQVFEEVVEDFNALATSLNISTYFNKAGVSNIWLVPDTGDCNQ